MNRTLPILSAFAFGSSLLAACASQQPGLQAGPSVVPPPGKTAGAVGSILPGFKKCAGQYGVKVRPCPVVFTSRSQKIVVTISGPKVASGSYDGSCYDRCTITLLHRSARKWRIVPGVSCGKVGLLFQGFTRQGIVVGNAALTIVNKSC